MSSMNLHFLDARGALAEIRDWLGASLTDTHEKALGLMPIAPLDVVVRAGERVIPDKGHLGYAPEPALVFVTVDPRNPALQANADASLERMFAHELHHAARWEGPGYGSSLGEALVSEGLAGHSAQELFGGPQEPWERLPEDEFCTHAERAAQEWDSTDYGHDRWFFGAGDLPRWLGYSLGFRLVERFVTEHPSFRASSLAGAEAQDFRSCLGRVQQRA